MGGPKRTPAVDPSAPLAGDLLRVSGFASLVNAVFVGRTDDEEAQAEALRLLKVPTGVGYEQMLGTLSPRPRHDDRPDDTPRQFVFADGHGGVEKIRIDLEGPHLEHVRDALDTNPDANRISVRGVPAPMRSAGTRSRTASRIAIAVAVENAISWTGVAPASCRWYEQMFTGFQRGTWSTV